VGAGRRPPSWLAELLASPSRVQAAPVAPAHGLVLQEVGYPDAAFVADRARQARSLRTLDDPSP
jgi:tRNA pseudouridine38-40 synthase